MRSQLTRVPWIALALAASAHADPRAQRDESAWEELRAPLPSLHSALTLTERPGSELIARGAQLVRTRDHRELVLTCTLEGGPGEIRYLALDPAGLIFVAAERDVFVLSPDVEAFDPLRWREGAPKGSPNSVFVDSNRRLWIATDQEIRVVDPSFYWSRALTPEDGLPAPGPYRLNGESSSTLLVESARGVHRYHVDRGPKPAVTSLTIDGEAWGPERVFSKTYGDDLAIAVEGRATGGASFRYRLDGHHVWSALSPIVPLTKVSPGVHTLDVIAIDRDLARSNPARAKLAIAYPSKYDKRQVLPTVLGVGALTFAFFLVRAKRQEGARGSWLRGVVSACLTLAIGLQIVAGLVPHAKGWPFIGFSMYTNTYDEGSIVYDGVLTGIERDGTTRRLDFNALGHLADDRWQVLHPIIDGGAPVAREWVEAFNARYPSARIAGLQARADRRKLTPQGAVAIAPLIFSSYVHEAVDGER